MTPRPSPPYTLRRFSVTAKRPESTQHVESVPLADGTTRASARRAAHRMSASNPADIVTLVRDTRILTTFRDGKAMRAAAIAQTTESHARTEYAAPAATPAAV